MIHIYILIASAGHRGDARQVREALAAVLLVGRAQHGRQLHIRQDVLLRAAAVTHARAALTHRERARERDDRRTSVDAPGDVQTRWARRQQSSGGSSRPRGEHKTLTDNASYILSGVPRGSGCIRKESLTKPRRPESAESAVRLCRDDAYNVRLMKMIFCRDFKPFPTSLMQSMIPRRSGLHTSLRFFDRRFGFCYVAVSSLVYNYFTWKRIKKTKLCRLS